MRIKSLSQAVLLMSFAIGPFLTGQSISDLRNTFQSPPDDARVMMRWWWFGPAVEKPELKHELEQMKEGGFGGYEIQPVDPLELDDPSRGIRNLPYLSEEFLDDVRFVNEEGNKLGLRANLTLSSGWPYGGPNTSVDDAAGCIREVVERLGADTSSSAVPALSSGEKLLAVFGENSGSGKGVSKFHQMPLPAPGSLRLQIPSEARGQVLHWYIASRTGQQVKRPAVNADGFVLDHFSHDAVQAHLDRVADKLIAAFGDHPPYSVFSDSLEVYGADWTSNLMEEFRKRRGYDLTPHLPQLFSKDPDAEALSVRHDWGKTLTELVDENYLTAIHEWAKQHHTQFRGQVYGPPAVSLSSNALVDLPEGEGPQWRQFSFTRWATSASHVYGKPVTSAETWTWLHSPAFRATPLDMKAEADRFFLQGVNQLVGHGWPYSPPSIGEPGWRFYAAAVFNAHNPWWIVMPYVARSLQRVSWILRQGKPANDVAIYVPEDDAWAAFAPGKVALTQFMSRWITPELTQAIEEAGYNFDYIDGAAIAKVGINYPVLILPNVDRISPETLSKIAEFEHQGGRVLAVGSLPAHGTGLVNFGEDSQRVSTLTRELFNTKNGKVVHAVGELGAALNTAIAPSMRLTPAAPEVGFIRRSLPGADIFYVANTGNHAVHTEATFRSTFSKGEWFDADSGTTRPALVQHDSFELDLAPYESRVLVLHAEDVPAASSAAGHDQQLADLSADWDVQFGAADRTHMDRLSSWTDTQSHLYFSGVAIYKRQFRVDHPAEPGARILVDFGEGTAIVENAQTADHPGMRALYDPPIREAAVIYVNGKRVGSLWHPPYRLDITDAVKPGSNQIEVHVANTAINELAGQSLPDYRLLWARYGKRFVPQDMDHLEPIPSGLLGKITLLVRSSH